MPLSAYSLGLETPRQLEFRLGIYFVRFQQLIVLLVPNARDNDGMHILNKTIFASKEAALATGEFWRDIVRLNLSDGFKQVVAYMPADATFLSRSELRSLTNRRRFVPEPAPRKTDQEMQDDTADGMHKLLLSIEKVARRVASKDPRHGIANVRADDAWGAFYHLPADKGADERFEAAHIILQLVFMHWYQVMPGVIEQFFEQLEHQPPPMFMLLQSLRVGKDIDEEDDAGFDEAASLALNGHQYFSYPARLNMRDISELIFSDWQVDSLIAFLCHSLAECFKYSSPIFMSKAAELIISTRERPPSDSSETLDLLCNAIWSYLDEVEEAALEATAPGTDEQSNRALRAVAALVGPDRKYAAQCILLVAVVNWLGLSPVAPSPQSPESTVNSESESGSSSESVPLLDRGLEEDEFETVIDNFIGQALNDDDSQPEDADDADLDEDDTHMDNADEDSGENYGSEAGEEGEWAISSPQDSATTEEELDLSYFQDMFMHSAGPRTPRQEPSGPRWVPVEDGLREFGSTVPLQALHVEVHGVARATFVAVADDAESDLSDEEPDVMRIDPASARSIVNRDSDEVDDGDDGDAEEDEQNEQNEQDALFVEQIADMEPGHPVPPASWTMADRLAAVRGRGPFLFVDDDEHENDMPDLENLTDSTRASEWAEQDGIIGGSIRIFDIELLLEQGLVHEPIWRQEPENGVAPDHHRLGLLPSYQALIGRQLYKSFNFVPPRRDWVPVALEEYAFFAIRKSIEHQLPQLPTPSVTDLMVQLTAFEFETEAVRREIGQPPQPLPHASGRWETTAGLGLEALMAAVHLYGANVCGVDLRLAVMTDNRTPMLDVDRPVTEHTLFAWIYHEASARIHRDGSSTSHRYAALKRCSTHGRASHYMLAIRQNHFSCWST